MKEITLKIILKTIFGKQFGQKVLCAIIKRTIRIRLLARYLLYYLSTNFIRRDVNFFVDNLLSYPVHPLWFLCFQWFKIFLRRHVAESLLDSFHIVKAIYILKHCRPHRLFRFIVRPMYQLFLHRRKKLSTTRYRQTSRHARSSGVARIVSTEP